MYKIERVYYENNGPCSGTCLKDDQVYWFRRTGDVSITNDNLDERTFSIHTLTQDQKERFEKDHDVKCKRFGYPIFHGGSFSIPEKEGDGLFILKHEYQFSEEEMGDSITTIGIDQFENYYVIHRYI
jgi:hypothetical protein